MSIRIIYLRDSRKTVAGRRGKPVGCVAIDYNNNKVSYGISSCSPKDTFDKTRAREIAQNRLAKHGIPVDISSLGEKPSYHDIVRSVMKHIKDTNKTLPKVEVDEVKGNHDYDGRSFNALCSASGWLKAHSNKGK